MLTRRGLFGRMLVAASAFVVAPAIRVEAAPSEGEQMRALVNNDVLANPGKHPEIEARARELMGEPTLTFREDTARMLTWRSASNDVIHYADDLTPGERQWVDYEFGIGPITFEAMQADCAARGCELSGGVVRNGRLEPQVWHFSLSNQRLQVFGRDESLHLPHVDAWRRSLHEQVKAESRAALGGVATWAERQHTGPLMRDES